MVDDVHDGAREEAEQVARLRAERDQLAATVEELRQVVATLPQIVWTARPDGWHTYFNRNWTEFTGLSLEESLGHGWNPPFHPDDRGRAREAWTASTRTGEPYEIEYRLRRHDGVYHWMLGRAQPLRDEDGRIVKWFGTCTDIEELKAAQEREAELLAELERRATHDPLTGLANRALLFDQLELLLDQRQRTGIAVAFVDLDGFKEVNDKYGHLAGDRALAAVANRLLATVRQGDIVARIGGDEFIVVGEADDASAAAELRTRVATAIEQPLTVGEVDIEVRASVGVAFVAPGEDTHADDVLSRADHEMYAVKRSRP